MPLAPPRHAPRPVCPQHRSAKQIEQQRNAEKAKTYDGAWRRLRAAFLAANPTCAAEGCGKPSTDVDHVQSVRSAPHMRLDPNNLRAFCHACHSRRTALEQGGWARRGAADR
jgi:5-methylcytosine-specific restriction endonuclease McrA